MWVVVAVVSLVGVVSFLLWVPVDLAVHLDVHGESRSKLKLRLVWLFGLVSKEVRKPDRKPARKKAPGRRRPGFLQAIRRTGALLEVLKVRGLLRQAMRLLRDVFRQVRFRHLEVSMAIGLDDPADTGFLFAFIGPVLTFLGPVFPGRMGVQPVFGDSAVCDGYLHGVLRIRPSGMVIPMGRFIFSPPMLRLGKTIIRMRWKARK